MLAEFTLLSLLVPLLRDEQDKKYALLLEEVEKHDWKIVRCSTRELKHLFVSREVYKVTVEDEEFLISIPHGNTHLFNLLKDDLLDSAKALLKEAKL
jgi:hypothetical protein